MKYTPRVRVHERIIDHPVILRIHSGHDALVVRKSGRREHVLHVTRRHSVHLDDSVQVRCVRFVTEVPAESIDGYEEDFCRVCRVSSAGDVTYK